MELASPRPVRLVELEAIRGIASIVVLVHHCLLGFAPTISGLVVSPKWWSLFGTPFFAFINGTAAVVVFFVLSGFVLTYWAIETEDGRLLGVAALKRWPRLAFPVVAVNILAAVLLILDLYSNRTTNNLTDSVWLGWFYGANRYQTPELFGAVYEGVIGTFLFGKNSFNSNLWTMYYEFFGSFMAFGLGWLLIGARMTRLLVAFAVVLFVYLYCSPIFLCLVAGVALAFVRRHLPLGRFAVDRPRLRTCMTTVGLAAATLLFGYHEHIHTPASMRFYECLAPLANHNPLFFRIALHTTGAVIVLLIALAFADTLRTPFMTLLGRLSFPIYLLQIPVICSIGCYTYLSAFSAFGSNLAALAAIAVTMIVTVALALPLSALDLYWLTVLKRTSLALRLERGRKSGA
jgi:peptidoglycan/LPS O-acetylase OafA/YrhL